MVEDREALKQEVVRERRYWHPFHEGLLEHSPAFLRAYLDYISAPWKSGHLEPKVREFIYIAVDGAVSHLYERGLKRHMEFALEAGATREELLQVVQLTCSTMHETHELGMGVLVDELKRRQPAIEADLADLSDEQQRLKRQFIDEVGYWPACGNALLRFAPQFVEGFLKFRSVAWSEGPLEPKIKELIGLAIGASPTILYEPAVRAHTQRALRYGATPEEISEVLQLAGAVAIHTATAGVPALVEAMRSSGNR